ncbi:hypothetical protein Ctob_007226 [Chrysochromulina tobinii]|uniref:Uncharacterized protein n=1 Tax=Chrysochromulina tobinii TaxID=1460289 RepID=A0A0M0J5E3_9EUKA|nr:hypothetical protein Ctob_007226 [Chrysochromulina tobinii]|eukprot:KOO21821.1 hypothetical protein Ctob_007226 [Chrysochromulina sp. CCMP291]
MPRTSPEPAQATAASRSSSGGSPLPSMQLRRAALARPPRNSRSRLGVSRSTSRTAATLTVKPSQRSRARLGSILPAAAASHGRPASTRTLMLRSVISASSVGAG